MQLLPIADALPDGLDFPAFDFLHPDHHPVRIFLLQIEADLIADDAGVRHANAALSGAKCADFLAVARQRKVDIAVLPEYCCPWNVLIEALSSGSGPVPGQMWIVGCEAIAPERFGAVLAQLSAHATCVHEPLETLNGIGVKRFLDPVCFVFNAKRGDEDRLTVAIQFKTAAMGGSVQYELQHLITGQKVYLFANPKPHTIKLICFLCSDVLQWGAADKNEVRELFDDPDSILLFHLQLNKSSRHVDYREYRKPFLFSQSRRELICLNWARNVRERPAAESQSECWNNNSVSAIYSRLWESQYLTCDAMEASELRGLYFCWASELRSYVGVLNFREHCFELTLSKVWREKGPAMQRSPRCPEVTALLRWSTPNNRWEAEAVGASIDPEYQAPMVAHGIDLAEFPILPSNPVLFENLAALCVGRPTTTEDPLGVQWPDMRDVDAHRMKADEIILRTSFSQDTEADAVSFRNIRYTNLARFVATLHNAVNLPRRMRAVFSTSSIAFDRTVPYSNIRGDQGRRGAAIYLDSTALAEAEKIHTHIVNRIRMCAARDGKVPQPDPEDVVVWYQNPPGGSISFPPDTSPKFDGDPDGLRDHIASAAN